MSAPASGPAPRPAGLSLSPRSSLSPAAEEALLAGVLWRRLVGFWIDGVLIVLLCVVLWTALLGLGVLTLGLGFALFGALAAVPPLYHFLFLLRPAAATPGQAALGLTLRRIEDFSRPDAADALVWVLGFYATLALGTVWFAIALFTPRHRALHDMIPGLVMLRRRALGSRFP